MDLTFQCLPRWGCKCCTFRSILTKHWDAWDRQCTMQPGNGEWLEGGPYVTPAPLYQELSPAQLTEHCQDFPVGTSPAGPTLPAAFMGPLGAAASGLPCQQAKIPLSNTGFWFPWQARADSPVPAVLLPAGHLFRRHLRDALVQAKAGILAQRLVACCGALCHPGGTPQAVLELGALRPPWATGCAMLTWGTSRLCSSCSSGRDSVVVEGAGSS